MTIARAGSATDATGNASSGANLTGLLRLIPLQSVTGPRDRLIKGVSVDSREVEPGGLFVAIRGEKADGNRFVDDAVSRGAVAVVSEMPASASEATWVQTPDARKVVGVLAAAVQGNPSQKMSLVGITGTNGKTTTAFLVDGLLARLAPPSAMLGTVMRKIGERSEPSRYTTPEAPAIQKLLAEALAAGSAHGVLEVSSHGLALHRLEGTEFRVTVFTNLSRDHLDFHHDMEDYFRAKRLLFTRYARAGATAVVSIDDAYGERLAAELGTSAVTFGLAATADLSVSHVEASLEGIRFQCREGERTFDVRSPLLGRYNALNLVAALAAVRALGFDEQAIVEALETVSGAPGRFERVLVDRPFDVIVDYAHTDDALRKLLEAARPLTRNQLVVVFGCGGERDRTKRPLMGDVASRLADRVVLTSDNPRGEDPEAIVREIQLGVKDASVRVEVDRRKAIELALSEARPGDLVVIAGKGHEPYQIVGDRVLPFDDREVVREIGGASP
ncbi:MAG TPA: UDP-N-acetylmuramoyl-L-alanyl-D-glutamate--2,6-diaminopimelate ligase [Vicinamibacteria bacterium]|nr:UDP-N-acetylmuramoyl-L-alanyl-D-glutamate--2,6-diaminopimelate ligase [Vicinamibacteria bacterium]